MVCPTPSGTVGCRRMRTWGTWASECLNLARVPQNAYPPPSLLAVPAQGGIAALSLQVEPESRAESLRSASTLLT